MASRARWRLLLLLGLGCGREVPIYPEQPWAHEPPSIPSLAGRTVVANSAEDSLSVLDPAQPTKVSRLPIGFNPVDRFRPRRLASDPLGRFLYVLLDVPAPTGTHVIHGAMATQGWITRVDTATVRAAPWAAVDPRPGDLVTSSDGRRLYLTHYDTDRWAHAGHADPRAGDANLTILDAENGRIAARIPLCPAPHGLGLSRDERTLYATCVSDEIAVVDLGTAPPAVRRVPLPQRDQTGDSCFHCPFALGVAPDGLVWVGNRGRFNGPSGMGSLMVYDPATGGFAPGATIHLQGRGAWIAFGATTAGGYRAYLIEQGMSESQVHIYAPPAPGARPTELEVLRLGPPTCTFAHALAITADGRHGHLVCEGDHQSPGTLLWLGLEPLVLEGSVPLGLFPEGVALVPPR